MSPPGIRPTALIDFRSPDEGVAPLPLLVSDYEKWVG